MATLKQNKNGFTPHNGASKGAKSISNTSGNTERDGVNAHKEVAMIGAQGPHTNIGPNYSQGSLNENYGAGRIRNIRLKHGKTLRELV